LKYISILYLAILTLLTSCAGSASFREFNATNSISAIDEIALRRRKFNNFETSMTIGLESPKGKIHIRCQMKVSNGSDWKLKLSGPLGVDLVIIEIIDERFMMKNLQQGESIEGYIDEVLYIPNMDIELPALKVLLPMLIPSPNIFHPQDWTVISSSIEPNGKLNLNRVNHSGAESISLRLDYNPLRILSEEVEIAEHTKLNRTFQYQNDMSYLPKMVEIGMENLKLNITYNSLIFNRNPKSSSQLTPL